MRTSTISKTQGTEVGIFLYRIDAVGIARRLSSSGSTTSHMHQCMCFLCIPYASYSLVKALLPARVLLCDAVTSRSRLKWPAFQQCLCYSTDFMRSLVPFLFINHLLYGYTGKDRASGRICAKMLPGGIFRGNVFHNNEGFGWYVLRGFPLNVRQLPVTAGDPPGSEGGFVYDWSSCSPVVPTNGRDNSAPLYVEVFAA